MDAGFLKITQCARRLAHKLYSLSSTEQRTMAEIKEKKKKKEKVGLQMTANKVQQLAAGKETIMHGSSYF